MTKKRPNLAGLGALSTRREVQAVSFSTADAPAARPEQPQEREDHTQGRAGASKSTKRPSRENRVFIGGYFDPEVRKQIKMIGIEQDKTLQQLTAEALNHMFASYGKPEIAPTETD